MNNTYKDWKMMQANPKPKNLGPVEHHQNSNATKYKGVSLQEYCRGNKKNSSIPHNNDLIQGATTRNIKEDRQHSIETPGFNQQKQGKRGRRNTKFRTQSDDLNYQEDTVDQRVVLPSLYRGQPKTIELLDSDTHVYPKSRRIQSNLQLNDLKVTFSDFYNHKPKNIQTVEGKQVTDRALNKFPVGLYRVSETLK